MIGSALQFLKLVPYTLFSDKYNPFNLYLVKYSWLWTLFFLLVTITVTAPLYSGLEWTMTIRHFMRLGVGHLIWYWSTALIRMVDNYAGTCSREDFTTYETCLNAEHNWNGFDISGHIFLLTYCILVITEEASNIKLEIWDPFTTLVHRVLPKLGPRVRLCVTYLYTIANYLVEAMEIYGLFLVLAWMLMVTSTALYFHTFMEKVVGYFLGVSCWYVTYCLVYGKSSYSPCRPSVGTLHPLNPINNLIS